MSILAKSDGLELSYHSKYCAISALRIFRDSTSENYYKKFSKIIHIACLLHDIGKCTKSFQNFLINEETEAFEYSHNQIGAAFLSRYLKIDNDLNNETKILIVDSVYWHHGVYNNDVKYDEIFQKISPEDILTMKKYVKDILGESYLSEQPCNSFRVPLDYFKIVKNDTGENDILNNINKIIVRSCVIGGDRLVSKFNKDDISIKKINDEIYKTFNKTNTTTLTHTKYDGSDRFNKQKSIVKSCDKTTIINAPAGFGKTLMGLMWGIKNNKKIIWVCPRNMVAESAYSSIINELESLNLNLSVELYLTGEVKKSNNSSNGFESDIIITNIDSFLFTSTNNNKLNYLYLTNNVNVIFDEYHELVTKSALMSLFILIMNIRHNILNSETLLLSATFVPLNKFWDKSAQTTILPSKFQHYDAAHNKKYSLNIVDYPDMSKYNTLTIFNSISESQISMHDTNCKHLIHSNFEEKERNQQFDKLINLYGKKSIRNIDKNNVIGTHVIQASLDISFNTLNESILSPESTLQRIGRCDRWGDYNNKSIINIFSSTSKSEEKTIENIYNKKLNKKWYNFIYKYDKKDLTLNELYNIYNIFSKLNQNDIENYIDMIYDESIKNLEGIYPIKYNTKSKSKYYTSNCNKLRSSGNELFVIYKKDKTNTYTEVFTQQLYYGYSNIDVQFHENEITNILAKMKKELARINDIRYDYNFLNIKQRKNKTTLDNLRKRARKSLSPYLRYDKVYTTEYGIISKKLLNEFK